MPSYETIVVCLLCALIGGLVGFYLGLRTGWFAALESESLGETPEVKK